MLQHVQANAIDDCKDDHQRDDADMNENRKAVKPEKKSWNLISLLEM
jgi:hypothetical protein